MREFLVLARSAGDHFEVAWRAALAAVKWPHDTSNRRQWREALDSYKDEYRAAYELRPTRAAQNAAALLAALEPEYLDPNEYELIAAA